MTHEICVHFLCSILCERISLKLAYSDKLLDKSNWLLIHGAGKTVVASVLWFKVVPEACCCVFLSSVFVHFHFEVFCFWGTSAVCSPLSGSTSVRGADMCAESEFDQLSVCPDHFFLLAKVCRVLHRVGHNVKWRLVSGSLFWFSYSFS